MFSIRDSAILWPSYVKYSELITLSSKPLKEWLYYFRFLANSKKKKKKWTVGLVESLQKYHLNLWKYLTFYLMYKWLIENICGRKQQRFWTKRKNCISMWIVIFGPSPNLDRVMMFFLTKDKLNSNIYEKKFTIILYWMQTVSSIFQVPGFLALLWLLLPLPDPPPLPPSDGLLSSERYFLHWKRLLSRKERKNVQSYLGNSGIVMYWRPFSGVQKKNGQPKKREMEGEKNPWDIKW